MKWLRNYLGRNGADERLQRLMATLRAAVDHGDVSPGAARKLGIPFLGASSRSGHKFPPNVDAVWTLVSRFGVRLAVLDGLRDAPKSPEAIQLAIVLQETRRRNARWS